MSKVGDLSCKKCHGEGFIYSNSLLIGGHTCSCMDPILKEQNVKNTWQGLEKVVLSDKVSESLPLDLIKKNAWITGSRSIFRQYLKKLLLEVDTNFSCKVRTDAELLDSWFGTAKAQGTKIFDLEIDKSTLQAIDIPSLVEPYDLTIIWLGVKSLPNKEAPSSLLEVVNLRNHISKPTWIVDQPDKKLDETHRYYSEELSIIISSWTRVQLGVEKVKIGKSKKKVKIKSQKSISQGEASNKYLEKWTNLNSDPNSRKYKKKFKT